MNLPDYLRAQDMSHAAFARLMGVSQPVVSGWVSGVAPVPEKRCVRIEQLTGGAVTRRDLRPDDWREIWPELAANEPGAQAAAAQGA